MLDVKKTDAEKTMPDPTACKQSMEFRFEFPPFPAVATQLVSELNNSEVRVPKIVKLIESEPTIASKVLQLANSPLYGAARPIRSIDHAIVLVGFRAVSQLSLTIATGTVFKRDSLAYADAQQETYRQSLAIATVARSIAKQSRIANPDEAFLAAVMQDIGKLVLLEAAGSDYVQILSDSDSINTTPQEYEAFGTTHAELGKICADKWGLDNSIKLAIANHHSPIQDLVDPLSKTVCLAGTFAQSWQIGFDADTIVCDEELRTHSAELHEFDLSVMQEESLEQFAAISEICLG